MKKHIKTCTQCNESGKYITNYYIDPALMPNRESNIVYKTIEHDKFGNSSVLKSYNEIIYKNKHHTNFIAHIDTVTGKPISFSEMILGDDVFYIRHTKTSNIITSFNHYGNIVSKTIVPDNSYVKCSYVYEYSTANQLKRETFSLQSQTPSIQSYINSKEYEYFDNGLIKSIIETNKSGKYITTYKYDMYNELYCRSKRSDDGRFILFLIREKIEEKRLYTSDGSYGKIIYRKTTMYDKDDNNTIKNENHFIYNDKKVALRIRKDYENGLIIRRVITNEGMLCCNTEYMYTFYD